MSFEEGALCSQFMSPTIITMPSNGFSWPLERVVVEDFDEDEDFEVGDEEDFDGDAEEGGKKGGRDEW